MTVTTMPPATETEAGQQPRSLKKLVVALVAAVAILGYGAWHFVLAPAEEPSTPVPGEVLTLEAIQVNLAGGHYLRLGLALQLDADAHGVEGSRALDRAIEMFSGQQVADVTDAEHRTKMKERLSRDLFEVYDGDVLEVLFTDFVTQ